MMFVDFLQHSQVILAAVPDQNMDESTRGLLAVLAVTQIVLLLLIIFSCLLVLYVVLLKREIRKLKGIGDGLSQALWAHRRDKMRTDGAAPKKKVIHDRVRKALFSQDNRPQGAELKSEESAEMADEAPEEEPTDRE